MGDDVLCVCAVCEDWTDRGGAYSLVEAGRWGVGAEGVCVVPGQNSPLRPDEAWDDGFQWW